MKSNARQNHRILAIAPSSRGFGFAVLEGENKLVDWGVKSIKGNKNAGSVAKTRQLIAFYQPEIFVLEDASTADSRRSPRIQALTGQLLSMAENCRIRTAVFSRRQIRKVFFAQEEGTKHAVAEALAIRFPEGLGFRLPPKRRPWMSEDYRMDIFDAVALAVVCRARRITKQKAPILTA